MIKPRATSPRTKLADEWAVGRWLTSPARNMPAWPALANGPISQLNGLAKQADLLADFFDHPIWQNSTSRLLVPSKTRVMVSLPGPKGEWPVRPQNWEIEGEPANLPALGWRFQTVGWQRPVEDFRSLGLLAQQLVSEDGWLFCQQIAAWPRLRGSLVSTGWQPLHREIFGTGEVLVLACRSPHR